MRRVLWSTVCLAGFVCARGAWAEEGDVNGDGKFDAADALFLLQTVREERALTPEQSQAGDLAPFADGVSEGDDIVDAADLAVFLRGITETDLDGDTLGVAVEEQAGSSPFARDSDGDGIDDDFEDGDGDGLLNYEEQALGSSASDAQGIGVLDVSYQASVATARYAPGTGPKVLFYNSRPNVLNDDPSNPRSQALKQLLIADGYQVEDFSEPPYDQGLVYCPTLPPISEILCGTRTQAGYCNTTVVPECLDWLEALQQADVFVIPQLASGQQFSVDEARNLNEVLSRSGISTLLLTEREATLEMLTDRLGWTFGRTNADDGESVVHSAPSCPAGVADCPRGWSTFRTSDEGLSVAHETVTPPMAEPGGLPPDSPVTEMTAFLGAAVEDPDTVFLPDPHHATEFEKVATLQADASYRDATGAPVSAEGLGQGLAFDVPEICGFAPWRAYLSADIETFTALEDAGGARGLQTVPTSSNQQFVRNVFHWLDFSRAPNLELQDLVVASVACPGGGQVFDSTYVPTPIENPSHPPGEEARFLVDASHQNFHQLGTALDPGRFYGFGLLAAEDGFVSEDFFVEWNETTPPFLTQEFMDRVTDRRPGEPSWTYGFSGPEFTALLADPQGYDPVPPPAAPRSPIRLLAIVNPGPAGTPGTPEEEAPRTITALEFQPVMEFVNAGGALLLITDHAPFPGRLDQIEEMLGLDFHDQSPRIHLSSCHPFASPCPVLGAISEIPFIRWDRNPLPTATSGGEGLISSGHPIVDGDAGTASDDVQSFRTYTGSWLELLAGPSPPIGATYTRTPLLPFPTLTQPVLPIGLPEAVALEIGNGRAFVATEAGSFTAQAQGYVPSGEAWGKRGINSHESENEKLVLNVLRWLDKRIN